MADVASVSKEKAAAGVGSSVVISESV